MLYFNRASQGNWLLSVDILKKWRMGLVPQDLNAGLHQRWNMFIVQLRGLWCGVLLLELAGGILFSTSENAGSSHISEHGSTSFLLTTPSGPVIPDSKRVYNASAVKVLIQALLLFTPKVQLEVLSFIEKLARAGSFNQENLTSVG
ncbi:hypothetical protein Leryth_010575 [Lithospermum erythrorhizon]|nr:hypothetical protein Leryth_010575 [Lithospermum erythrorhizon]